MNTPTPASTPDQAAPDRLSPDRLSPDRILLRLDWQVIRRLDGLLQGDYRSLFYGYGIDFADLREYEPEDDIRYIDWNVTARMNTPYVRKYVEDREITAWFLLDMSPSMDFGAVGSLKRMVLVDFVATFARLLTRHGNRVGAMLYTGQKDGGKKNNGHAVRANRRIDRTVPARGGRVHVLRLINDLLNQPFIPRSSFTDLTPLLDSGLYSLKKRSLVFIVSDFISAPGWDRPLKMLNQRHEVLAVRLWDSNEMTLPDVGPIIMEDAETGEQLYVDTHDKKFRAQFELLAQQREAALNETFRRAGVDVLSLSTGEDLVRAIVRLANQRQQRRRQLH